MNTRVRNNLIGAAFLLAAGAGLFSACRNERQLRYDFYYANGKRLYEKHCQNCHAADGKGLGALIPPLNDSVYLRQNRTKLVCFIRNGVSGPVSVRGKLYFGEMPGNPGLAPIDLAQLITYFTNSFGNRQGLYDVSLADNACPTKSN